MVNVKLKTNAISIDIPDYIFDITFVSSFIASIILCINTIFSINIINIFVNENISFFISLYLFLCGYISFNRWRNAPNIIGRNIFGINIIQDVYLV